MTLVPTSVCAHCGLPILGAAVWKANGEMVHADRHECRASIK